MIGGREEHNVPFSNLPPDPLPPSRPNPRAPNYSPAPGRGMSERVSRSARHRRPSVTRRAAPSRTLSSHHLIPSCSAAYPHHRRHLSKRAVFGSSFDAHTVIAPPRRTPGKNALSRPRIMASHQGIHPNAPPHDKQDEAKDRTRGWRAVFRSSPHSSCLVSIAAPSHIVRRGFPSRGGGNSQGGHIFRAVFLSSSHPPRLIASSVPRLTVPSGRASKQARQDGGRSSLSAPSSYPRPVSSSPRLATRVARAGRRASRSRRPARSGSRFLTRFARPRSVARYRRQLDPAAITASKQSGRSVPVPPLVSAGGKSSAHAHRIGRRGVPRSLVIGTASTQARRRRFSSRQLASDPFRLIRLVPHVG